MTKREILNRAIREYRNTPFNWNTYNCGLASAKIASSYAGEDFGKEFEPYCNSSLSAMRMLKERGGFPSIMRDLGFATVAKDQAEAGDAITLRWNHKGKVREALGLVVDHRAIFVNDSGLIFVDKSKCSKAWRVPQKVFK
jgi:hypothetical protein